MHADEKILIEVAPHVEHCPAANRSCMIRTRQKPHRYLILEDGVLELSENLQVGGGWLWHCCKDRGWYGFRNTASGTYLGHEWCSGIRKLLAEVSHHLTDEHFMVDRQIDGGYTLLAREGDNLLPVMNSELEKLLLGQVEEENVMAWEFIDVKFVRLDIELTVN
jgi:hypothetical protein